GIDLIAGFLYVVGRRGIHETGPFDFSGVHHPPTHPIQDQCFYCLNGKLLIDHFCAPFDAFLCDENSPRFIQFDNPMTPDSTTKRNATTTADIFRATGSARTTSPPTVAWLNAST